MGTDVGVDVSVGGGLAAIVTVGVGSAVGVGAGEVGATVCVGDETGVI